MLVADEFALFDASAGCDVCDTEVPGGLLSSCGVRASGGAFSAARMVLRCCCTAADSLSGVASTTCANVSGTAWSFGPGPHTFSATATDNAGNIGGGSTTFTVVVSSAALCTLTGQFVDGSANYQALKPAQRKAVDVLVNTSCSLIISLGPKLAPGQTQAFINAYKASLETFVKLGWLTQGQAGTLGSLAGAL